MIPPVADRFVAGETPTGALEHARDLNQRAVGAIINHLGEHHDRETARADAAAYRELIDAIAETPVRACLSVKPTQLGLGASQTTFRENLASVVSAARDAGVFVWVDMEGPDTVTATLEEYEAIAGSDTGVCLQANLRRTRGDLEQLAGRPGSVRLVKGAYTPTETQRLPGDRTVDEAYRELLELAFRSFDAGVAVATHDAALIDRAVQLHETHGTPFQIQMLMGVREELQFSLAADHDVWQYVPYGGRWLSYFARRLAERRENLAFAIRAVMR